MKMEIIIVLVCTAIFAMIIYGIRVISSYLNAMGEMVGDMMREQTNQLTTIVNILQSMEDDDIEDPVDQDGL